jgi:hypothetical protein
LSTSRKPGENSPGFLDVTLNVAEIITGATIMLIIALYEDDLSFLLGYNF